MNSALPSPVPMVNTAQVSTSCMNGASLKPCTTASLCIRIVVSWSPIRGIASNTLVGRLNLLLSQLPGRFSSAGFDRAVGVDFARATDADEWSQPQFFLLRPVDQPLQHLDQAVDGFLAIELFVAVPPQLELPHFGFGQIGGAAQVQLDDSGTDIGPADIDREDRVVRLKHPRRGKVGAADEAGFIGIFADDANLGFDIVGLEQHRGAADGQLADAAAAKAAADHHARCVLPAFELEKAPQHDRQFLRKQFDRALDDAGNLRVAAGQQRIKLLFGDLARRFVAERVLANLAQRFAPVIDEFSERALAGAVAHETFVVF